MDAMNHEGNVRQWGFFEVLSDRPDHKVNRITVYPGQRLSLQRHFKRAEHWYIVSGEAIFTLNDTVISVKSGDSVNIGRSDIHRIANNGSDDVVFIEVQTGDYFGEDDIERLEDDYGRMKKNS
jgi:mannose-6-phosphate isomerase